MDKVTGDLDGGAVGTGLAGSEYGLGGEDMRASSCGPDSKVFFGSRGVGDCRVVCGLRSGAPLLGKGWSSLDEHG